MVMEASRQRISDLLRAHRQGDQQAFQRLIPLVYPDLRRIAHARLRRSRPGETLNTTALVHELYLRLSGGQAGSLKDRAQFFALASRAMRQIIVDHLRHQGAVKRGNSEPPLPLHDGIPSRNRSELLLTLNDSIRRLEELDPRMGRILECRFYAGLTEEETAAALNLSLRTVQRTWARAKAWLRRDMPSDRPGA